MNNNNHTTHTPYIMGVLNLTPDSFSDGGKYQNIDSALTHIEQMITAGADIIDIGGQSSRPGATPLSEAEELDRICPVLEKIQSTFGDVKISIDTFEYKVMQAVMKFKPWMINDIYGFNTLEKRQLAKKHGVRICIMHMQNSPKTMQNAPQYKAIVNEVSHFLQSRITTCEQAGIDRAHIFIDPGFGFGKTLEHNISLLKALPHFASLTPNLLVGLSRKTMIGELTHRQVDDRLYGSIAAATIAHLYGAQIIRVHDVLATKDALSISTAIRNTR